MGYQSIGAQIGVYPPPIGINYNKGDVVDVSALGAATNNGDVDGKIKVYAEYQKPGGQWTKMSDSPVKVLVKNGGSGSCNITKQRTLDVVGTWKFHAVLEGYFPDTGWILLMASLDRTEDVVEPAPGGPVYESLSVSVNVA